MKKINKLFAVWQPFEMKRSIYLTTFANDVKRALKLDEQGFYFIYEVGKIVKVENFNTNRWDECSTGIHFFINRENASYY